MAQAHQQKHLKPLFLFLLISFSIASVAGKDTIFVNTSISGDQTLASNGGNFVLGFFQPGNSSNYYLGIWYNTNKITKLTQVWVANRETPVTDHMNSELKISKDGNLVLLNESKSVIWSTNLTAIKSSSTVAVLNDTGNFILRDGLNPSNILWQSFDHPSDTWLPGGKLSVNKITKQTQHLTSWKSQSDPAPGMFSLELDPNGSSQYLILWNLSKPYWTSGPWDGQKKRFSGVPEMTLNYAYDFHYVNLTNESYFTYTVKEDSLTSRFIMDTTGQIKQLNWLPNGNVWFLFWSQPRAQCEVLGLCGAFGSCNENEFAFCNCVKGFRQASPKDWALNDWSSGCVRNRALDCNSSSSAKKDKDKFFQMDDVRVPLYSQSLTVGSLGDCETACLKNCSCSAYSYNSSGCFLWFGDLVNLQQPFNGMGSTLYLRLAASELPDPQSNKRVVIGSVVGAAIALAACLTAIGYLIHRRQLRQRKRLLDSTKAVGGTLVMYRYGDLQLVTKNFSLKLGGGGFGSVFKGVLPDSTAIAVKKLEGIQQGEKQFRAEVSTIGTIQHVNLVRLRGFCSEGNKRLLAYDFMPKGSLADQLFNNEESNLDWNKRYQIALGTARGLYYLHEKCRECIIHCDIKPENILLDDSYVPKVADFGLAKLIGHDFSRVLTTMRGTRGYLAPEWISGVPITPKADVYSYGMMLFELISGRRNSDERTAQFFPSFAANRLVEGDIPSILDYRLEGDANLEEVARVCKIALWSIQDDENFRPTMGQVAQILEGMKEVNMPPLPRSLQIISENPENIVFFSDLSSNKSSEVRSTASISSQPNGSTSTSSKD